MEVVAKSRLYNHKKKTSDSWGTKFSSKFAETKNYWVILGCIHKIFKSTLVDIANSEENKYRAERLISLENIAKSSISINNIKTTFSWSREIFKIPSFLRLIFSKFRLLLEASPFYLNNLPYRQSQQNCPFRFLDHDIFIFT